MAALRRVQKLLPPPIFISRRGVATKLFVGAKIVTDRVTDRPKGFGFVTYASEDEAEKAMREMDGKPLEGRVIFVDYAKQRADFTSYMPIARGPPEPAKDE